MNHTDVQDWLNRYVEAWRTHDRGQIEALFTDDAVYRYHPYGGDDHANRGREAIVQAWLEDDDPPNSWEASYTPFAVDDDRAVATGFSRYFASDKGPERTFHNVFLLRFADDGRCGDFTEYYMREETGG
ncbi:MAG TPA: nuclear transport factor 2 family protein [Candidatus Limnocylindria bacterium]|nr:nuclear transport factor 2 family protein [Candidatus Limnocylindria bacterium]